MLQSPPSRRRELKSDVDTPVLKKIEVAFFMEAWIEMLQSVYLLFPDSCRLLHRGVD